MMKQIEKAEMTELIKDIKEQTLGFVKVKHLAKTGRVVFTLPNSDRFPKGVSTHFHLMKEYFAEDFEVTGKGDSFTLQYRSELDARSEHHMREMSKYFTL